MGIFRSECYSKNHILYKRDNYHKWPWAAILVTCTVSGIIFLYIGVPRTSLSGSSLNMSIALTVLGTLVLLPVVIVIPTCLAHKIFKACGKEVPVYCRCLDPFLVNNKSAKKAINFYEHRAKDIQAPVGGNPSVYFIQMQEKHKHLPNPKIPAKRAQGQSIVLDTQSSHLGESSDYKETHFNSNQPQSSNVHQQYSAKSQSNGSTYESAHGVPNTLRHEATKSQYAAHASGSHHNQAYLEDETHPHRVRKVTRPHRTKESDSHLDNQAFSAEGDPGLDHHYHPQQLHQANGIKQQPIEVHVQIIDSDSIGTISSSNNNNPTTGDETRPDGDTKISQPDGLKDTEETDTNNNGHVAKNQNISDQQGSLNSQNDKPTNRLSVDSDLIIEEKIVVNENEDDKDSAVCDVEDYVFGGGDEVIDARSDFCTNRHSPHSPNSNDTKEEYEFDHTSSVHSSEKVKNQKKANIDADIPSDCSVLSINSKPQPEIKPESVVVDNIPRPISQTVIERVTFSKRRNSDRSLASFFTQESCTESCVSQERLDLETLNSQLDAEDTYSLVSESEYSVAAESLISRAPLDELEARQLEVLAIQSISNSSASNSIHNESSTDSQDDWKRKLWNKSSEPDTFQTFYVE